VNFMSHTTEPSGFFTARRKPPTELAGARLMREFKATGEFWLPGREAHRLWGMVTYTPGSGTHLTLEGGLGGREYGSDHEAALVVGTLHDGTPCSLRDARWSIDTHFLDTGDRHRTKLVARTLLLGIQTSATEPKFQEGYLRLSHLDDWFENPLQVLRTRTERRMRVEFAPDRFATKAVHAGVRFGVSAFCSRTIPVLPDRDQKLTFSFGYKLRIRPDRTQPLRWYVEVSSLLRDLFVFLTGASVCTLELHVATGRRLKDRHFVTVYPTVHIPALLQSDPNHFNSRHKDIAASCSDLAERWFSRAERLATVRQAIVDLLTIDGASAGAVFARTVATLEHMHGLIAGDKGRYVPKLLWKRYVDSLKADFTSALIGASGDERAQLEASKDALVGRMREINSLTFQSKIRDLFDALDERHLMPILGNPEDAATYLDAFIPSVAATRNHLAHARSNTENVLVGSDLEAATLRCWAILVYHTAIELGLDATLASDMALRARRAMFLVAPSSRL
jgi:hypothetical protein